MVRYGYLAVCALVGPCFLGACSSSAPSPLASCQNGIRDGAETDVDCGGDLCPACADDRACLIDRDCSSGLCRDLICRGRGLDAAFADGGSFDAGGHPDQGGGGGAPSCQGLAATCGGTGTTSCCESPLVPGGTFLRGYDGVTYTDTGYPATVSDFRLDKYEVTVGRFRKFLADYPANLPSQGAGKNPNNGADPGWNVDWNTTQMPASTAVFREELKCHESMRTWTDNVGANENKPINCINWYEAFAFCIWDGGRLPTEAELGYAGSGGGEQRAYAWSNPPTSLIVDGTYAVYSRIAGPPEEVGSKSPVGDGRWGHAHLSGNVFEWALDRDGARPNPCVDCTNFDDGVLRIVRGGSLLGDESYLRMARRTFVAPAGQGVDSGVRCARQP